MTMRQRLLEKICCPHSGETLSDVPALLFKTLQQEQAAGNLFNELGMQVEQSLVQPGLVNESLTYFVLVRSGVPDLTPDHLIPIDHLEFYRPNSESAQVRIDE